MELHCDLEYAYTCVQQLAAELPSAPPPEIPLLPGNIASLSEGSFLKAAELAQRALNQHLSQIHTDLTALIEASRVHLHAISSHDNATGELLGRSFSASGGVF
ncbi:hypothetical protein [Corynebacterium caspium]|uniref:hypothetical protein n=1 Tax=Corynebacterium caspium TaxID=234828 RepID=UPI00039C6AD8|nr:hypothetical protein [Corynebacterium caspium]WKD59756.1 hypothetical protein CCASP_06885 [Corynebacterium caspium DSM 44850]